MKEFLPAHLNLSKALGRQRFARGQAGAVLEFLHSEASWGEDEGRAAAEWNDKVHSLSLCLLSLTARSLADLS